MGEQPSQAQGHEAQQAEDKTKNTKLAHAMPHCMGEGF